MHPSQVLFQNQLQPTLLPVCDHYAGSEKLMRKSMSLQKSLGPIFDITFDCEDGAATGNEAGHAHLVTELLNSDENLFGRIGVRVHDVTHHAFQQDIRILLSGSTEKLAYIVLPKINSVQDVLSAAEQINQFQGTEKQRPVPLHVLIETHEALANVMAIAAIPQVECLSFGIMDFVSAHVGAIPGDAMHSPGQFTHPLVVRAKSELAAACHRYGKTPSHNVTTEIANKEVAAQDALLAKNQLGYTRMWSIHPDQISAIVNNMSPQHDEIMQAHEILQLARQQNWGPIQFQGRLHDRASYRYFWTVLKRAELSAIPLPDKARELL